MGDRKAEEEPIAELLATTTTQRGARPVDAQQAGGLRDTPWFAFPNVLHLGVSGRTPKVTMNNQWPVTKPKCLT